MASSGGTAFVLGGGTVTAAILSLSSSSSSAPAGDVYYANYDAVRAAGAAPLHRDDPGYSRKLDRNEDGVACE